jgi:uncharacterized protein YacL
MVISSAFVGFQVAPYLSTMEYSQIIGLGVGGVIGLIIVLIERAMQEFSGRKLIAGVIGLIIGLIVANLVAPAILSIVRASWYIHIMLIVVFSYLSIVLAVRKIKTIPFLKGWEGTQAGISKPEYFIVDTSVIIDGRIADVLNTGFMIGKLLIAEFVLKELQTIADSSDSIKRKRGRRGLDILKKMQDEKSEYIEITHKDYPGVVDVDTKLIKLTEEIGGKLITNDFNLNKVAELQGVEVLNLNDLANSLKPIVLPGEELDLKIIKEGKEYGQGIGYLEDGTMVIVEEGRHKIGEDVSVVVTSVLQTAAGRMIFSQLKELWEESENDR